MPIYWLITILVIPIWFIFPEFGGDYHRDLWSIFMSLFLIPQEGNLPHISVAWTLSYEILFYFLFSFFIINKKIGLAVIFIWQVLVVYYLFTNPEYHYLLDFIFNKYNLLFLVGILAAKVTIYFKDTVEGGALFFVFGSFLFILVGVCDNLYNTHSKGVFELFYGIPAFIILVYSNSNKINYYFSTKKILILLGDASYSIYLIHTFALSFFAKIFYYINLMQHISSEFLFLILSVLAIIAGVLVHIILEKRLLAWIWLNLLNKKL